MNPLNHSLFQKSSNKSSKFYTHNQILCGKNIFDATLELNFCTFWIRNSNFCLILRKSKCTLFLFYSANGFRPLLDNNAPRATPPIFLPTHLASLGSQFHPPLFPHLKGKEEKTALKKNTYKILLKNMKLNFLHKLFILVLKVYQQNDFVNRWFHDRYSIKVLIKVMKRYTFAIW